MSRFALFGSALALGGLTKMFSSDSVAQAKSHAPNQQMHLHKVGKKPTQEQIDGINEYYKPFKLGEILNIAEDVAIFRFLFEGADTEFNMKPCSTLMAGVSDGGGNLVDRIERFYTPITANGEKGYFDILVKKQRHGRMTEHLFSMKVGEEISFKRVLYKIEYQANKWKNVGMIGAGTGITPLLQVVRAGLDDSTDQTKLSLLFANRSPGKILLRGVLDDYKKKNPERFNLNYIVDDVEGLSGWDGYTGLVNDEVARATMPPASPDNLLLLCGPDRFMITVAGCTEGNLGAMSTRGHVKGCGPQLNNSTDIPSHCVIGRLGWEKEWVHRF